MGQDRAQCSAGRRVAFVLPDLGGGGAERLTLTLAEAFTDDGWAVDLVLLRARGALLDLVPPGVGVVDLGVERMRDAVGALRRYFSMAEPHCAFVSLWPLTTLSIFSQLELLRRPRLVLCEHNNLEAQFARTPLHRLALLASLRLLHPRADAVIAVSQGLATALARLGRWQPGFAHAVPNPVEPPASGPPARWPDIDGPRILSVGSLKLQKDQSFLLEAFAAFRKQHGGSLAILGEGDQRPGLEKQVERLGLAGCVRLPGFVAAPGDWYDTADLFVSASRYEGFGNVIVEAMHCGLPVVARDCPFGPSEILDGEEYGRLVAQRDPVHLAAAMATELAHPAKASRLKARAAEFSPEAAFAAYRALALGDGRS